MGLASPVRSHNPDKIIINHSSYQLSDIEKTVLAKGLNFALPPKKLNYADYLTPYECSEIQGNFLLMIIFLRE